MTILGILQKLGLDSVVQHLRLGSKCDPAFPARGYWFCFAGHITSTAVLRVRSRETGIGAANRVVERMIDMKADEYYCNKHIAFTLPA